MKRKRILSQEQDNRILTIINKIEKRLRICFIFMLLLVITAQTLLYYDVGNRFLNSVYKMEENLFSKQDKPIYKLLRIYGDISEHEDVWILKNGIKIGRITAGSPVYIQLFAGDVIEIDATSSSGLPREIFIENITSSTVSESFPERIVLVNKFYRMPPFYGS